MGIRNGGESIVNFKAFKTSVKIAWEIIKNGLKEDPDNVSCVITSVEYGEGCDKAGCYKPQVMGICRVETSDEYVRFYGFSIFAIIMGASLDMWNREGFADALLGFVKDILISQREKKDFDEDKSPSMKQAIEIAQGLMEKEMAKMEDF